MAEETITAASSPATEQETAPVTVESLNREQRSEWLKTGKMPEPTKAESAPAAEQSSEKASDEAGKSAPASEAGKEKEPASKPTEAEKRIKQLLRKVKELEGVIGKASQPALTEKPKEEPKQEAPKLKRPRLEDFDGTLTEYEEAVDAYHKAQFQEALAAEREATEQRTKKEAEEKKQREFHDQFNKKLAKAHDTYEDFDEVTSDAIQAIPKGTVMEAAITSREFGMDVLYKLASEPDELERIAAISDPLDQAYAMFELEAQFRKPAAKAPDKKFSSASGPATEVGAKATNTADEAQAALDRGDGAAYRRIMNARELAARRG